VAFVVFLRGVNVGGHRTFRPAQLVKDLQHLGAVNIGAAGTFVFRRATSQANLRAELKKRLPFDTDVMICQGRDIVRLLSHRCFSDEPEGPDVVRFVSVLARAPKSGPRLPLSRPEEGQWLLKVLARDRQFVFGMYRRHALAVRHLGTLDRLFGMPATTRNLNTMAAIAKVLASKPAT
jgi:uncharacterized protein (DUF1697 family)